MERLIADLFSFEVQDLTSSTDSLLSRTGSSKVDTTILDSSLSDVLVPIVEKTSERKSVSFEPSSLSDITDEPLQTLVAESQLSPPVSSLANSSLEVLDVEEFSIPEIVSSPPVKRILLGRLEDLPRNKPLAQEEAGGLQFQFNAANGTPQEVIDGFIEAGELWSNLFSDNMTVQVDIDFAPLGPGILGGAASSRVDIDYSEVVNALGTDASSSDDNTAVSNLPADSIDMLINHTRQNRGRSTPYLDDNGSANNTTVSVNTANAKALGINVGDVVDGDITFSSNFDWDFDRSDGITTGTFHFVGVAAHEIGHVLGFVSELDTLDRIGSRFRDRFISENNYAPAVLDLYRFSDESAAQGAIDFTTGDTPNPDRYFSIDGGTTNLALFATGVALGDGRQASHWKDDASLGLMDPTFSDGELGQITALDIQAFDVIGYDLA